MLIWSQYGASDGRCHEEAVAKYLLHRQHIENVQSVPLPLIRPREVFAQGYDHHRKWRGCMDPSVFIELH
jgi:hypothetical protein